MPLLLQNLSDLNFDPGGRSGGAAVGRMKFPAADARSSRRSSYVPVTDEGVRAFAQKRVFIERGTHAHE
eukprot:COSAG01_NODE_699_length_14176_cov_21.100590_3_plen_69_part_00